MPRKTTKKPTTKRKKYQTGGTAKPQMPRSQALAMQEARDREAARQAAEEERRRQTEMMRQDREPREPIPEQFESAMQRYRREQGLMELGNRQRAAAARARAQRPTFKAPSRAQQAKNLAEYNAAMAARQRASSRGSTPARPRVPTAQQLAEYQRMVSNINRSRANAVPATPRQQPRPQMRTPTPQELARLRANPNRPNMANQVQTLNQGNALKRQRIQQQIAQLQAQLRQLGG